MKNRIIIAAAITVCLALCAAVWPQTEKVEKPPTPSETANVTTPRPTLPEPEELILPAITEKQESGMPEAESAPEVAAKELPIPAPEIEKQFEAEQKTAPPMQTEPAPVHPTQSESAPDPIPFTAPAPGRGACPVPAGPVGRRPCGAVPQLLAPPA